MEEDKKMTYERIVKNQISSQAKHRYVHNKQWRTNYHPPKESVLKRPLGTFTIHRH